LNHPLDCPVCDQAGECELQDYSYVYGFAESRLREQKIKQRKKDVGRDMLLYADRCIMCTRCVRFAREVSGFEQVGVFNRGAHTEIDVFPGIKIDDLLAGNIADICPVGAFLSKDFLFKRRVWELKSTESICPACSVGCNVLLDHADGEIMRLRPRANPDVNGHWMCDIGRMDYKLVTSPDRLKKPVTRERDTDDKLEWADAIAHAGEQFKHVINRYRAGSVAFIVSSDATNEEAYALWKLAAGIGASILRLLPGERADKQEFAGGFVVENDRSPNERGVLDVLAHFVSPETKTEATDLDSLEEKRAVYVLCGAHSDKAAIESLANIVADAEFSIVQATLPSALTAAASVVLPGASFAEKEGTYANSRGIVQRIRRAFDPPGEARRDIDIIIDFSKAMGVTLGFETLIEASAEMSRMVSGYAPFDQIGEMGWKLPASGSNVTKKG
jgi:NADH-quinone oxidoreductase subunit G